MIRFRRDRQRTSSGGRWPVYLMSMGLGAALSYVLDPVQGRSRRARARDKAHKVARLKARDVGRVEQDVSNRARGLLARLRGALRAETPDDEIVRERVRSALGRLCSHPRALEVSVTDGTVRLKGAILEREHDRVLHKLGRVPGVRAIADELSRHREPHGIPGLQGEHTAGKPESASSRCADLMKRKVWTIRDDESVAHAAELMALANVGFLPVCDSDGKVVGTITDRDVVVRMLAKAPPWEPVPVATVMTRDVVTCRPDDEVSLAEQLMAQRQVSRILITDEGGKLAGVISLSDIAKHEPIRRAARTLRAVATREAQHV